MKQRHYAFNVIRDLVLLAKVGLPDLYSIIVQSLLVEGLEKLLETHFNAEQAARREWNELNYLIQDEVDFKLEFKKPEPPKTKVN